MYKYLVKKVIKGQTYYYLQYKAHSKIIGKITDFPDSVILKKLYLQFFWQIGLEESQKLDKRIKNQFPYSDLTKIEQIRYNYTCLSGKSLFEKDYQSFLSHFAVVFTLNSNRSEGSKITRDILEKVLDKSIKKPTNTLELEALNSMQTIDFAFSKKFKWNIASLKKIHKLLLGNLYSPLMVGQWKNTNNVAPANQITVAHKDVPKAMENLLNWLKKAVKQGIYPPLLAIEFYCKFERIHPFEDGNGRVGRILLNRILHQFKYMPVVFYSTNHQEHCEAIRQFLEGRKKKLNKHFCKQAEKTFKDIILKDLMLN